MKKVLISSIICILFFHAKSQEPLAFSKVIEAENKNKTELFIKINDWFAVNYNSANDVIQMADKEAGIIVGKGNMDYSLGKFTYICYDGILNYTVKVQFKDNRFKVDISNFIHSVNPGNGQQCNLGLISINEPAKKNRK